MVHAWEGAALLGVVMRFIVASLVILFLAFLLPGFTIVGFWTAIGAAAAIALAGWGVEAAAGHRTSPSPYARGLVGFAVSALILYLMPFVVRHAHISALGALLAALIIGVIDAFVPADNRL